MPDAKAKGKGGNPLTRRVGPLPVWGWAAAGGGGFLVYRFLRARRSAGQVVAATGTTGGGATGTIPTGTSGAGGSASSGGAGTFSSMAAWEQALLTFLTGNGLSAGDAFSGMTSYLAGNCVSQAAYNALSAALVSSSVGLPPGFTTNLPTLSVCPSPVQTPTPSNPTPQQPAPPAPVATHGPFPGLWASLTSAMTANGESVAATQWDQTLNEWIVLTNKGGIYDVAANGGPGSTFWGSYLGLPAADRMTAPGQSRIFNQLKINGDGTYTAIDTNGESYTFTPTTPQGG